MKRNQILIGSLAILFSTASSAGIISYGGFTHDTTTNIVVGNGLEWLQWDETVGMSWNDANAQKDSIAGGGWEIATNAQMASLFNDFDFGITFDSDENTQDSVKTGIQTDGVTSDPSESDVAFVTMFGQTYASSNLIGELVSYAYFGQDLDGDGLINLATVWDDYINGANPSPGVARLNSDVAAPRNNFHGYGVALVRSPVPEPSTISLATIALAGIGLIQRRNNRRVDFNAS